MSTRQLISVAIIGCGWAGERHALSCKPASADVKWLVDTNVERAKRLRSILGPAGVHANVTSDYHRTLNDPDITAVILCTPHNLHAPMAIEAAKMGKHVLVEKPLASNLQQADAMIKAAHDKATILMVAENVRFNPVYLRIASSLQAGYIGEPATIQIARYAYLRESFLRDRPWFLDAEKAAGGIMMSGGIHDFETMRMLMGNIKSVYSLQAPQRFLEMEGDDTSTALIKFHNGSVGLLYESFISKQLTTAAGPEVHTLRIDGGLGSIIWDGSRIIRMFSESLDKSINSELVSQELYVPEVDTFQELLSHFLECVLTGQEPITSGWSQREALVAVMAAYQSMKSGLPVDLADI